MLPYMREQMVFKRYELKYLITKKQKEDLTLRMEGQMDRDAYGRNTIFNIYCDTPTHLLIRRSLEKPVYKEKLRIRSYGRARADSLVFVELKKKYKSVVYKRRIGLSNAQAMEWIGGGDTPVQSGQIGREIQYVLDFYENLQPAMFLSYEREAFFGKEDKNFRVTFDEEIRWRTEDLSLMRGAFGVPLLKPGQVLMEVKTAYAIPLWMTEWMTENRVYKTSFSKYGNAYERKEEQEKEEGKRNERNDIWRAV